MAKVKTFSCEIKIFQTKRELEDLDQMVNNFIERKKVISVSDAPVNDDRGATIGITRVVTYE